MGIAFPGKLADGMLAIAKHFGLFFSKFTGKSRITPSYKWSSVMLVTVACDVARPRFLQNQAPVSCEWPSPTGRQRRSKIIPIAAGEGPMGAGRALNFGWCEFVGPDS